MLATFLIGLREGLEASLVVAILIAYLVRTNRRHDTRWVWGGVAAAVAISLAFGGALALTSRELSFTAKETFGGLASIVSVALVTWMVFWMRRTSRSLRGELHGKLDAALALGAGALVLVGFVAVGREGLETALFLFTAAQSSSGTWAPFGGAVAGLLAAATLGRLFYAGALKINLARFFKYSGVALIVIAAGVLAYGFHDLQEAQILPGLAHAAFDVSNAVPPTSWYGQLLKGSVGFTPNPTWLELAVWAAYLVPVLFLYLRPEQTATAAPLKPPVPVG